MNLNNEINKALNEFIHGDKQKAYKKLFRIFKKDENNDQLRFNLAVVEEALNLNRSARVNYEYLVNKKNIKAVTNLYLLNMKEEKFSEALKLINMLIYENQISNKVLIDKAFVLNKLKRYNDSIVICKKVLKKNSLDVNFLNILGLNYLSKREMTKS